MRSFVALVSLCLLLPGLSPRLPTSAEAQSNAPGPTHVALGSGFGCGLAADGTVRCWGDNSDGQCGSEGPDAYTPRPVAGLDQVVELEVGYGFACARRGDGSVWCWGDNGYGQLGVEGVADRVTPAPVPGVADVTDLAVGAFHACALSGGRVSCWGSNSMGALVLPESVEKRATPTPIRGLRNVQAIHAGGYHSCAVERRGRLRCWGSSAHGQAGTRRRVRRAPLTRVRGAEGATSIDLGGDQGCLIDGEGALRCWGANIYGAGDGQGSYYSTPQPIERLSAVRSVSTRAENVCAVAGGQVHCWGVNRMHQLHVPTDEAGQVVVQPSALPGVSDAEEVVIGWFQQCYKRTSGAWMCWGRNVRGATGTGQRDNMLSTPAPLAW